VPETILASEALVEKGRYDEAIRQAGTLIRSLPNTPSAQRGRVVLAKAYTGRGLLAFNLARYPSADADLRKGVEVLTDRQIDPADVSELFTLGLSLVFQYHETFALKSPKAFEDSYQLLVMLKAVSDRFPRSSDFNFGDLHANLAESSLTTGRYDEALRSAEQAIESAKPPVKDDWASNAGRYETTLNAKFIATTAHVLKGDQAAVALARKDLVDFYALRPKDFVNHWSYVGTQYYLEHAGLPAEKLRPPLEMLRIIQPS
jgi:tetratricopeptide (TPR) repeat protein